MTFPIPRLYAIIDPAQTGGLAPVQVTEILLQAGVRLIQYRDKRGSSRRLFEASVQIADRVREAGGIFLVNDRADVASLAGADGVHVGQDDLPVELARRAWGIGRPQGEPAPASRHSGLVGCSTHTLAQVRDADNTSADYIAFGPIFATESKEKHDPVVGLKALGEARRFTRKPLVAIGGITLDSAVDVIQAGADSVAVIGDLLKAPEIGARAREFLDILRSC